MKDDSSQKQELNNETLKGVEEGASSDSYPSPDLNPNPSLSAGSSSSSDLDQMSEFEKSNSSTSDLKAQQADFSNTVEPVSDTGATSFSSVATTPGSKRFLVIGIVGLGLLGLYFIVQEISSGSKVEKTPTEQIQARSQTEEAQKLIKDAKTVSSAERMQVTQAPKLPPALPIQAPQPPDPPPPPVPAAPQVPIFPQAGQPSLPVPFSPESSQAPDLFIGKENDDAKLKALEARRKASIMVLGGSSTAENNSEGGESKKDKTKDKDKKQDKDKDKTSFLGFGEGAFGGAGLSRTKASQIKATQIGDLSSMIAQGKIIHAILETAINTDLPGTLRAIITRDVYAESGNAVLVPKGSRVIGKYETQVKAGQTRVAVMWNRLIRPDGVDIAIDSQGTDTLGKSGVAGYLDDKLFTKLGNAFLISFVVPAIVGKIFKVKGANDPVQTTTSTNALLGPTVSTTKTTSFKQEQVKESSDKFNEILSKTIQDTFATTPTIFVDQGTEINIFVNRDLIFPPDSIMSGSK